MCRRTDQKSDIYRSACPLHEQKMKKKNIENKNIEKKILSKKNIRRPTRE